jgi:hypothetical protein
MAMPMVAVIRETEAALLFVFSRSLTFFPAFADEVVAAAEG